MSRKILDSCFDRNENTLLEKMLERGIITVQDIENTKNEQIMEVLEMNNVKIPEVQKRQRGGSIQYYVNVPARYSATGKRHQIIGKSESGVIEEYKKEAYKRIHSELNRNITVSELVELYIENTAVCESTRSKYYRVFKNHVQNSELAKLYVENVKAYHCVEFMNSFYSKNLGYSYVNQIKSIMSGAFKYGILRELKVSNYFQSIQINKNLCESNHKRNTKQVYDKKDLKLIEEKVVEAYKEKKYKNSVILLLLAYTGMRIGELLAIQHTDIDKKNKLMIINKSRKEYTDYKTGEKVRETGTTKNKSSERIIYLNDKALYWIEELEKRNKCEGIDSDYLVCTERGTPPTYNMVYRQLKSFCEYAGVTSNGTHIGRKTNISIRIESGEPIASVAKSVGHEQQVTTVDIYNQIVDKKGLKRFKIKPLIFNHFDIT